MAKPRRRTLPPTPADLVPSGFQDRLRAGRYSPADLDAQTYTLRFWHNLARYRRLMPKLHRDPCAFELA